MKEKEASPALHEGDQPRSRARVPRPGDAGASNDPLRTLQNTAGNQAVAGLLASGAIQASLRISRPGDADEIEADRVAQQVVSSTNRPAVARKCDDQGGGASCPPGEEEQVEQAKGIHRKATTASGDESARADLLQSIGHGQPLDPAIRDVMEPRFGRDFSQVTIHTSREAASSAQQIQARAYTADQRIVFGEGQYAPSSKSGMRLLAHELAHVSQNQNARNQGAPANTIHRDSLIGSASNWLEEKKGRAGKWIEDKKWAIYRAMIAGLKAAKNTNIGMMRALVPKLPASFHGAASSIIDAVDFMIDLEIGLLLAIVGLAVGFVEGIVGLITGLVKLAMGLLKMAVDLLVGLMGKPEEFNKDLDDLAAAVKGIPPGLKQIFDKWTERYSHATLEEQVLMGGELVGQVEAFIATFALAGTKAGQAVTLTVRAEGAGAQILARGGVAALERAPAISVTIPAVVPQVAAEGTVITSQMAAMTGSGGGGGGAGGSGPGSAGGGPLHGASDEELENAIKNAKPAGDPIQLHPHGAATDARKALGVSGKDVQSAHGAPRSVMKGVGGYNPNNALAKLLDTAVHSGMDQFWKDTFMAMRRAGRTNATAQEIHDIVAESIRRAPGLSAGEKGSLVARLTDEMFVESGLKPGDVLDLPYPNIGP